jgi:hypothetical protein
VIATDLTPEELAQLERVGLVRATADAQTFELTWEARTLLGEKPQRPKLEPLRSWLARLGMLAAVLLSACGAPETPQVWLFSPDAFLESETVEWAERWSRATGVDIHVGPGGVAVTAVDHIEDGTCELATAASYDSTGFVVLGLSSIVVDITPSHGCTLWSESLGHGMGHVLGGHGHAESGLMASHVVRRRGGNEIDLPALELVCANLDCSWMQPEPHVTP